MSTQTEEYDVLILGTGVTEAILAGALAKAGKRVVHVDSSDSYGGSGKALSVDAFLALPRLTVSQPPHESVLKEARKYALEMTPKLIYGNGELVEAMISSAVANYLEFRAVEGVSLLWDGRFETVPCSKEDVFKNDSIPLLEKRRLMKLLSKVNEGSHSDQHDPNSPFKVFLEAQGLTERSQASLFYGVGQLIESKDANATLAQGFAAIKRFLGSIGRFGSTPFLSGVYGTASEISQAFCRVCAVFGGTYML
ncbi:GDP dissociation inhibitor, partial [Chytriomyces sp. MP71]